jgi:MYXO-CTERM domain-containing protein
MLPYIRNRIESFLCNRSLMSGALALAVVLTPRSAYAGSCTVPSDCFAAGQVCHLGVCTPCESSFDDGGLGDPLIGCQDPSHPICDIPDGSIGGQCVQCTKDTDCTTGDRCDQTTQTCVAGDGGAGDAAADGSGDAQPGDAAADGAAGDAAATDGAVTDGHAGDGASSDAGDGGSSSDAGQDGALEDGAGGDGSGGDASDATVGGDSSAEGGGARDGAYVEGDGCGCRAAGQELPLGGAALLGLAALVAAARRRSR